MTNEVPHEPNSPEELRIIVKDGKQSVAVVGNYGSVSLYDWRGCRVMRSNSPDFVDELLMALWQARRRADWGNSSLNFDDHIIWRMHQTAVALAERVEEQAALLQQFRTVRAVEKNEASDLPSWNNAASIARDKGRERTKSRCLHGESSSGLGHPMVAVPDGSTLVGEQHLADEAEQAKRKRRRTSHMEQFQRLPTGVQAWLLSQLDGEEEDLDSQTSDNEGEGER